MENRVEKMKTTEKTLIILFLMGFFLTSLYLGYRIGYSNEIGREQTKNISSEKDFVASNNNIYEFIRLGADFSNNHSYEKNIYTCKNFSLDFATEMNSKGYEVSIETGCNSNMTYCHAWNTVCFDYDPQTGWFRNVREDYPLDSPTGWKEETNKELFKE